MFHKFRLFTLIIVFLKSFCIFIFLDLSTRFTNKMGGELADFL
jgi:hypothetical protein